MANNAKPNIVEVSKDYVSVTAEPEIGVTGSDKVSSTNNSTALDKKLGMPEIKEISEEEMFDDDSVWEDNTVKWKYTSPNQLKGKTFKYRDYRGGNPEVHIGVNKKDPKTGTISSTFFAIPPIVTVNDRLTAHKVFYSNLQQRGKLWVEINPGEEARQKLTEDKLKVVQKLKNLGVTDSEIERLVSN